MTISAGKMIWVSSIAKAHPYIRIIQTCSNFTHFSAENQ